MSTVRKILYKAFSILGGGEVRAFEAASQCVRNEQSLLLQGILQRNAQSVFGQEHGFAGIRNVTDFQKAVPIRDYEQLRSYTDRAVNGEKRILTVDEPIMYATTSGTSGDPKYMKGVVELARP